MIENGRRFLPALAAVMVSMAAAASVSVTNVPPAGMARFRPVRAGTVTVRPSSPADLEKIEKAIVAAGGRLVGRCGVRSSPSIRAEVDDKVLQRIAGMAEVRGLENVRRNRLHNDVAAGLMGVTNVWPQANAGVPSLGLTGKGQFITTSDSGIDTGKMETMHRDFTNNLIGFSTLDYSYRDSWGRSRRGTTLSYDADGHGTHTAGSIVGDGTSSGGQIKGVAHGARLWAWFCMGSEGGIWTPMYMDDLFRPQGLTAGTAYIHSASWGNEACQYDEESRSIDDYCWRNPDFLPVFSAGNAGAAFSVGSQAGAKNVLAVGSSQSYRPDESSDYEDPYQAKYPNRVSGFSSQGPMPDGRIKPDVVAPGSWILSTRSSMPSADDYWDEYPPNAAYAYNGGTSMACPLTAGAAALVREWLVNRRGFAAPSAALLKAVLTGGAAELHGKPYSNVSSAAPNATEGWGRVDLAASLEPDGGRAVYLADYLPFHTGSNLVFTVTTTNDAPLEAQLVWVDYPGEVYPDTASPVLVNNLDLVVTRGDGESDSVWLGNGGESADALNNVESVRLASAAKGVYAVAVKGMSIPHPSEEGGAAALYLRGAFDPGSVTAVTTSTDMVSLTITSSSPGNCYAEPPLGVYSYPAGTQVSVTAGVYSLEFGQYGTPSTRYPFAGFTGTGDVPGSGTTNILTFTLTCNSSVNWRWSDSAPDYYYQVLVNFYGYQDWDGYSLFPCYGRWAASNEQFTVTLPGDYANEIESVYGYHYDFNRGQWPWRTGTYTYRYARPYYARTDSDDWLYLYDNSTGMPTACVDITMDEGCDIILDYYEQNDRINVDYNQTWAPTWWILKYMWWFDGVPGFDATAEGDPDGDGFSNLAEYAIDTDPLDPASRLAMTGITPTNVSWIAGREVPQVLETRDALGAGAWRPLFTNRTGRAEMWYNTSNGKTNGFYRVMVPKEFQR